MKCISIDITICQETDEVSHKLFWIFTTRNFDEKQYPKVYLEFIERITKEAILLARGKEP